MALQPSPPSRKTTRDLKKEAAWEKKTYKQYVFKAKLKDNEPEKLKIAMNGKNFAEWIREKMEEDYAKYV